LMRILRSLRLPTLIFVNKIDRVGARAGDLVADIAATLAPRVAPLGTVRGLGSAAAEYVEDPAGLHAALAEHDDALLADLVADAAPSPARLHAALAAKTAAAQAYPLVFGCALSGAGVPALRDAIGRLLPPAPAPEPRLRGQVFAIERAPGGGPGGDRGPGGARGDRSGGEKVAYVRSYGGQLRARQRVTVYRREPDGQVRRYDGQVSALRVVGDAAGGQLTAGHIGQVRGLPEIRIGDQLGSPHGLAGEQYVARPSLETVVRPRRAGDAATLHAALLSLADQDPLIGARVRPDGEISLLLYGEVQKEVIAATLAETYRLDVDFMPTELVHLERPVGVGTGYEPIGHGFAAELGLRAAPAPAGAGIRYQREVELGSLPLAFHKAIEETVARVLEQGRYGWPVTDVVITLTHCGYWSPITVAGDFRDLTPLVLATALAGAGTRVYEPCNRFDLEIPLDRLGPVSARLAQLGARIDETAASAVWRLTGEIPARVVHTFQRQLPGLSSGYGTWSSRPGGDRPVAGPPPTRPRTDGNPFNRAEYLRHLAQRTPAGNRG
ncbi:MAG: ribosomal protection tetracycline resistance protein, partial [Mycobacteriales bacterium]